MLGYVIRRLLLAVPVMGVVALVVFSVLYLTPGDPAQVLAGDTATPEQIAKIRASLGLDQPPHLRFALWLWHMVHGDLGASIFSGEPVTHMIGQRLQPTFSLLLLAVVISIAIGVPFGVAAAARRGGFLDRALTTFTTLGYSLPAFIAGYGLAFLFATTLKWLPVQGFVPLEQVIDLHDLGVLRHPRFDFPLGQLELRAAQRESHVVKDIQLRVQRVTFKHHRHVAIRRLQPPDVAPGDFDAAPLRRDDARNQVQRRRLTGPGRPKHRHEFLVGNAQRQVFNPAPFAVPLRQPLQFHVRHKPVPLSPLAFHCPEG